MRCRGFTLLEMLAVVTLLALTWSLLGGALVPRAPQSFEVTVARARDLDQRARLASRCSGSVFLTALEHGNAIGGFATRSLEQLLACELPDGARIAIVSHDGENRVRFDATGQCQDYRATLTVNERVRHYVISGATGWWSEERASTD